MIVFFSIVGILCLLVFIIGQVLFVLDNTFFWKAKISAIKYQQFKAIEKGELLAKIDELKAENSSLKDKIKELSK